MAATLLDGKAIAAGIRAVIRDQVAQLKQKGIVPGLTVVLVGEDPASKVYVRNKERACREAGFASTVLRLAKNTSQQQLLDVVDSLNQDVAVHGILVQLPLPSHLDEQAVIAAIDPKKDVDGFHTANAGALMVGMKGFVSCTPRGVMELICRSGQDIAGKHAVVVGRSNIVGKPVALLLLQANATVTVCHSRTQDLAQLTRQADILVAAVGRPRMITGEMIKPGAIVIDVGINRMPDGSLAGDVDFDSALEVAGYLTPVPGGVGPMTIAMLLKNTLEAAHA